MRTMYDSTTPEHSIPASAAMVAGYVGGEWPNYSDICARWPDAVHVSIAVNAGEDAQVLDVETGDATPADAPAWAARQRARGQDPSVYCNTSTWPAVEQAFNSAEAALPHWWRADYNGQPALEMGEVAHQYRSDTAQNLDYSVVADYWPGVDPPPTAPTTDPLMEVVMTIAKSDQDAARGLGRLFWSLATNEEPDEKTLEIIAYQGLTNGFESMMTAVLDSPLAQQVRAARVARDNG